MKSFLPLLIATGFIFTFARSDAAAAKQFENPDLINGGKIPEGAVHDWNLGTTGARGWIYSNKLSTFEARQIAVTEVAKGSPAEAVLQKGDVILGVAGKPFSHDARIEFAKALTAAETEKGAGKLSLLRWRAGKKEDIMIQLPVMGTYSATAPYECPKSKRILEQGCKTLADRIKDPKYKANSIERSLNALALLASGNKEYLPLVKKEAEWAAEYQTKSFESWWYGYVITFLSEYVMATGDQSVMPGLRRLAMETAKGQSNVGSWGHGFANEGGTLNGYGMMNAPGIPLTVSLVLARKAGVKDPAIDLAIERSATLLRFYSGKGAPPYGDHEPWIETHECNGKSGMAAVLFNLLDESGPAGFFSRMTVAAHVPDRDSGHSNNFFNIAWALPSVSQSGPQATGAWMEEFGAWYFDLARRWDGNFTHQGQPQAIYDTTKKWDATGAYLLAYALPLRNLVITGKNENKDLYVDAAMAKSLINDGKGWSRHDRNSFYASLSGAELLNRLDSWSPVVRERAAIAIAAKPNPPMDILLQKLGSGKIESRYGACQTFKMLGPNAVTALPELRKTLDDKDLWLRILAAEAIAAMGQPGMPALPDMLAKMANSDPSKEDPRGMEQRYLSFFVFGKMLPKNSLAGVDRDLLRKAIVAGLKNEDGKARTTVSGIYRKLTLDEIRPIIPDISAAITKPAPSGEMFADGVRTAGLQILAKHKIMEALPWCIEIMDINRWGKGNRIKGGIIALEMYGEAAKPMLPQLHQLRTDLEKHRESKKLQPTIDRLEKLIRTLEK